MWDQLPAATRTLVTNMTVYEANRFVNYNVPYWANPNGSLNTPGDTKAEENAWNSRMLSVAVAMMPSHANSQAWRTKGSELMVSSFARPSDLTNPTSIDGKTVANWLHGYNAYETGFVENHGFIHDDYMATTGLTIEPFITQTLAGQTVPQAAGFNADVVYNAMATVPVGSLQKTMFQRGPQGSYVPDPYYPAGNRLELVSLRHLSGDGRLRQAAGSRCRQTVRCDGLGPSPLESHPGNAESLFGWSSLCAG